MNGGVKSRLTGVKPINYCYEDTPSLCVEVNLTGAMIHAQIEHHKVKTLGNREGEGVKDMCNAAQSYCVCV